MKNRYLLRAGTLLQHRYRIVTELGSGGMGAVYQAVDERINKRVAVKETFAVDDLLRQAFEREAKLLAQLDHPAFPKVADYFGDENGFYLVMDLIPGTDLAEMLKQQQEPFDPQIVYQIALQILDALEVLHRQNIVHRDLKPANIKLTPTGDIKILDFGIAKGSLSSAETHTASSLQAATVQFAPLEQILRANPDWYDLLSVNYAHMVSIMVKQGTDQRSDLYALGATLYQLLTGSPPENAVTRAFALWSGQTDKLISPHDVNPLIPRKFSDIVVKAMSLHREDRYQTTHEMSDRLARVFDSEVHSIGNKRKKNDYFNSGIELSNQERYSDALVVFNKCVELDPHDALAYNNRGNIFLELSDYEHAAQDYEKAIELDPKMSMPYMNLGCVYLLNKDYDNAIEYFDKAIELDPGCDSAWKNRASARIPAGDLEGAFQDCLKALNLNPSCAGAYYNLAYLCDRAGEPEQAAGFRLKYKELEND